MLDKFLETIGGFAFRRRYLIAILSLLLFIGVAVLQSFATISYSYSDYNKVTDVFPQDDMIVLVYENKDEEKMAQIAKFLEKDTHVTAVQGYATTVNKPMTATQLAEMMEIDQTLVKTLFHAKFNGTTTDSILLPDFVNFVTADTFLNNPLLADYVDEATKQQLTQVKDMVNGVVDKTKYDAKGMATLMGQKQITINLIYKSAGVTQMTLEEFLDASLRYSVFMGQEKTEQIQQMQGVIELINDNNPLSPTELVEAFPIQHEMFNSTIVKGLYLMYHANVSQESNQTLTILEAFDYITLQVIPHPAIAPYINDELTTQISQAKQTITQGVSQLVGETHSRMVISVDYLPESQGIKDFYTNLEKELTSQLSGNYYLVGNSAMSNELSKSFQTEYLTISIVTAVAIFLVVCVTFKRFSVAALLVCIIECAVFITMSVMTIGNIAMYFIALIIVQCILMGSMVDYGILLSNYYVEVRKEYAIEKALPEVLKRSIRAIATSAIILIVITFICGLLMYGAVAAILATLCIGSFSALILVVFALPSLLAIFDKTIMKKSAK